MPVFLPSRFRYAQIVRAITYQSSSPTSQLREDSDFTSPPNAMRTAYHAVQDYVISVSTIALAGLVLWGAKDIPPPFFDPLGSAAVPKAVAYVLILLALGIGIRRYFQNKSFERERSAEEGFKPEPILAVAVVGSSILYTLAMGAGWIGFRWGTIIYVFATGSILAKGNYRIMVTSLILGLLFGIGGQYLFTKIFYIDLP